MRSNTPPEFTGSEPRTPSGPVVDVEPHQNGNGSNGNGNGNGHGNGNGNGNGNILLLKGRRNGRGRWQGRWAVLGSGSREAVNLWRPSKSPAARLLAGLDTAINRRFYRAFLKRALDVVAGSILLALASPVIGLAWLVIRLSSRGPAVFKQQRVGRQGGMFVMYKLRTMYVDQEKRVDMREIERKQANGVLHKTDRDPRVTPVGQFLRKTSIDELPQLWNVIRGDMSLIGPRPLVPYMLAPYPEIKQRRSRVRPGVTGLWQVSARNDNRSALGMVEYDYHYVEHHSLTLDLAILLKTPFVVLGTRGAL